MDIKNPVIMMSEEILKQYGITEVQGIVYNPSYDRLYD